MPPAPRPANEAERLASVRKLEELGHAHRATETILCTVREQLHIDRAFINIVNESTQHPFLCAPTGSEASPRTAAFCGYVVALDAPVVVPDAAKDPRFADNPFVTSGFIRFYCGMPVYTPEGHVAGALCVHGPEPRDLNETETRLLKRLADMVTEELRQARRFVDVERQFRNREEQLGVLVANAPAALAMFDTSMRYLAASNTWRDHWLLRDTELAGLTIGATILDMPERWAVDHRRALAGETVTHDEERVRLADGTEIIVRVRIVPWRTGDQKIGGIIIFSEDITELVTARRELETSSDRLRLAVESARAGLWDLNLETMEVFVDPLWWELHGHEPGSLSNALADHNALIHPDDAGAAAEEFNRAVNGETDRTRHEMRMRDASGAYRWFEVHAFCAERDPGGRALRVVGLNLDIHNRKAMELARARQNEDLAAAKVALEDQAERLIQTTREAGEARRAAEDANEAKSRFLANMSHEIRTPMAAILGFTEVLEEPDAADAAKAEAIATIRRNGEHLMTLINDILDLSKIEAGKLSVDRVRVNPEFVIRESVRLIADQAARKGVEMAISVDPTLPEHILTDPTRLKQVLLNLLGNAVKFTESGSIEVHASVDERGRCAIEVRDTGIGMEPEVARTIFQPFVQADASTTRRFGGTGLGLTISARLAEMLGGDLSVARTAPSEGTTMRLVIDPGPLGRSTPRTPRNGDPVETSASASEPKEPVSLRGARVLVAEDGPDNQRLLKYMLTRAGADVEIVPDGSMAYELLNGPGPALFDLLLLDMQMPEMDGYTTAAALRKSGVMIPIIALTANAMDGDRARCLAAGCDDYASKPISSKDLIRLCARWMTGRNGSENRPAA